MAGPKDRRSPTVDRASSDDGDITFPIPEHIPERHDLPIAQHVEQLPKAGVGWKLAMHLAKPMDHGQPAAEYHNRSRHPISRPRGEQMAPHNQFP